MAKRRDKVVDLVDSMFEVERRIVELFLDVVPEEAKKHARAARKEKLLAMRAILDARIKHLEDQEKKGRKRRQKVPVQ